MIDNIETEKKVIYNLPDQFQYNVLLTLYIQYTSLKLYDGLPMSCISKYRCFSNEQYTIHIFNKYVINTDIIVL